MDRFADILALYEDFRSHKGSLSGGAGFFDYMAPSSIHSDITAFAYGIRKTMSCLDIRRKGAVALISLAECDLPRRFYVKLTACLFRWEALTCGIRLRVNGQIAYENDRELFENVNIGWPTVYIPIDGSLLRVGENRLELEQAAGETALLVSVLELLSLPAKHPGQQTGFRSAVRLGRPFGLSFHTPQGPLSVVEAKGCEVLDLLQGEETAVTLKATDLQPALTLEYCGKTLEARLPEILPSHEDICLVGTDSDDHRHDGSDETDRILEIFTNTNLGDFWQARPQYQRNYADLSPKAVWEKRLAWLRAFGTRVSLADSGGVMPYTDKICGDSFLGAHFHEAYLFFCAALERSAFLTEKLQINMPALRASESFTQSRELFTGALRRMYESCQENPGMTSVGSPSLLTVYEARAGFERVTIEPVSNIALLIGAVRGAAPRMWGAHVPTDWYFGEPNDATKSRKFQLAMQMLYVNGADYIYAENDLFKTNAFSREDWEDPFCAENRRYQREFFDYKERHPRKGTLQRDLAVIYGNNEFFLWHTDDRIAELPENGDWDQKLWGKWEDNRHHRCWRAVDAWLPLAQEQNAKENVLNLQLFSGSPYGAVDVLPWDGDYTPYRALALLGWNTCANGFGARLRRYLEAGGQAFVSVCHFNRTDRPDREFVYDREQLALLGVQAGELMAAGETVLMDCAAAGGEVFARDEADNVLVWSVPVGAGRLYLGTYADYTCTRKRMEVMKEVLRQLGEDTAQAVCDDPNICVTLRRQADGHAVIHALNVCAHSAQTRNFSVTLRTGQRVELALEPGRILEAEIPER